MTSASSADSEAEGCGQYQYVVGRSARDVGVDVLLQR